MITIPSKNNYNIKNNNIVRKAINSISTEINNAVLNIEHNSVVFDQIYKDGIYQSTENYPFMSYTYKVSSYANGQTQDVRKIWINTISELSKFDKEVLVPTETNNSLILKVNTGKTNDGDNLIQCNITGRVEKGTIYVPYIANATQVSNSLATVMTAQITFDTLSNLSNWVKDITTSTEDSYTDLYDTWDLWDTNPEIGTFTPSNLGNATASSIVINGENYFKIDLDNIVVSGLHIEGIVEGNNVIVIGAGTPNITNETINGILTTTITYPPYSGTIACDYEHYSAKQVQITLNGNQYKIELEPESVTIGNGKNIVSLGSNELIQNTNTPNIANEYEAVINEWKNGKETATLLCSISDYYDTDGNKIISTESSDKMCFENRDIVVPYICNAQGADIPMSFTKSGEPKAFEVIGTRIYSDGAVWQELTLLEKIN